MERTPLLSVDAAPETVRVHFEGSPFIVAEKPLGMPVHPEGPDGRGTLVNALFQSNRWLAAMETSHTPGVVHVLRPADRGLVLVAKTDGAWETLNRAHRAGDIAFRFRVALPADVELPAGGPVRVAGERLYGTRRILDVDATCGDTERLLDDWLGPAGAAARDAVTFVCYEIENPVPGEDRRQRTALGDRVPLPDLDVYAAPT